MSNRRSNRLGLILLAAISTCAMHGFAIEDSVKGAVRELSSQAKDDYDEGRFEAAADKFQRAYAAIQVPTLALWAARSLVNLGKLVSASELYRQALQLGPNELWLGKAQQEAQEDALRELEALLPRIAKAQLVIVGAPASEVTASIDGTRLPSTLLGVECPIDPGKREIVGQYGAQTVRLVVELHEGETKQVRLAFESKNTVPATPMAGPEAATESPLTPSARQNTLRTLGYVGIGVGAVGALVGAIGSIFVVKRHSDLEPYCPNDVCAPTHTQQSSLDAYNRARVIASAGFLVGGVGLAAGTVLILSSPSHERSASAFVGPGAVEIRGTF